MMWKSPDANFATISPSSPGHFAGKSSLPMIAMAALSCFWMEVGDLSMRSTRPLLTAARSSAWMASSPSSA